MNTTAAALQAQVSVPTIRTWCRNGVIAAAKQAGRWIIDAASLAARIAIGARRARKQDA
ncbi:helix-turn-helix domain-containing protein, partial [Streptomyces kaempferi]